MRAFCLCFVKEILMFYFPRTSTTTVQSYASRGETHIAHGFGLDRQNPFVFGLIAQLASRVVAAFGPGALILDVGCGPGDHLSFVQSFGARVLGVEPVDSFVAAARGRGHHDVVHGSMETFDVPDGVAGAMFVASLYHLPVDEIRRTLSRVTRKMRPGALVLTTFPVLPSGTTTTTIDPTGRIVTSMTPEAHREILAQAGLSVDTECVGRFYMGEWTCMISALSSPSFLNWVPEWIPEWIPEWDHAVI